MPSYTDSPRSAKESTLVELSDKDRAKFSWRDAGIYLTLGFCALAYLAVRSPLTAYEKVRSYRHTKKTHEELFGSYERPKE